LGFSVGLHHKNNALLKPKKEKNNQMNPITTFHLQGTKHSNLDTIFVGLCTYMQLSFRFLKIELKWFGIWAIFLMNIGM